MIAKILCPVDGSDHADKALDLALDLADKYGAELHLIHALMLSANSKELQRFAQIEGLAKRVTDEATRMRAIEGRLDLGIADEPISPRVLTEVGQKVLDNAAEDAREKGVNVKGAYLVNGDAAKRILDCIREKDIDCVIMGSRGLSDLKSLFMGSVSHKVANHAPCTCIAVK